MYRRLMFRGLRKPSYYQRLVMSHLLVLLLTVSIMAGFNYAFSRDQQSERMLEMLRYSGQQTASSIEARFAQMKNVSEMVRYTLQQTLNESLNKVPRPQTDADAMSTIRTLRDSFQFTDISAWLPSSFFSSGEGITFFNISAPDGRPQKPQVLSAPFNKLCWMVLNDYTYGNAAYLPFRIYRLGRVVKAL